MTDMARTQYQTFPTDHPGLPAEVVDLFHRMRVDKGDLLTKISEDAKSNTQVDLNGAIEEAYIRALVVAGVLMPLSDNVQIFDTPNILH